MDEAYISMRLDGRPPPCKPPFLRRVSPIGCGLRPQVFVHGCVGQVRIDAREPLLRSVQFYEDGFEFSTAQNGRDYGRGQVRWRDIVVYCGLPAVAEVGARENATGSTFLRRVTARSPRSCTRLLPDPGPHLRRAAMRSDGPLPTSRSLWTCRPTSCSRRHLDVGREGRAMRRGRQELQMHPLHWRRRCREGDEYEQGVLRKFDSLGSANIRRSSGASSLNSPSGAATGSKMRAWYLSCRRTEAVPSMAVRVKPEPD